MNAQLKTVADELDAMDAYESWRPALIAFLRHDGPWFQTIENAERGCPLTGQDRRIIDGLQAAFKVTP